MSTAYFYLTGEGEQLARRLAASHPGDLYDKTDFKASLREAFHKYDYLVCIMATGIVVRILAPLLVHKTSDPGVVVMDQRGQYAISLLSGHLGGANDLAREMAALSGGSAVITTATDVAGELSFDTFAKKHGMAIENIGALKHISGALLSGQPVRVITSRTYPELTAAAAAGKMQLMTVEEMRQGQGRACAPDGNTPTGGADSRSNTQACGADSWRNAYTSSPAVAEADSACAALPTVVIDEGFTLGAAPDGAESPHNTSTLGRDTAPVLYLRPRTICAGIGCKRNMDADSIRDALLATLKKEGLSPLSLKCISTIPLKADEPGILATARQLGVPLTVIPTADIEALDITGLGIQTSGFVAKQTGVLSVSTASAYLASGKGRILRDKEKYKGITIALCQSEEERG